MALYTKTCECSWVVRGISMLFLFSQNTCLSFRLEKESSSLSSPKENAPDAVLLCRHVSDAEELYLSHAATVRALHTVTELHKGNLNVVIAFDCDKILVFVLVAKL